MGWSKPAPSQNGVHSQGQIPTLPIAEKVLRLLAEAADVILNQTFMGQAIGTKGPDRVRKGDTIYKVIV